MSYNDSSQRSRGPPSGFKAGPNARPPEESRNRGPPSSGLLPMTRAERFEDERRRIIDSCFSKKDADGADSESYITHIRVVEDPAYPSSLPTTQSSSETKKHRVLIISVRKSGLVQMHKARQNDSGTFSIGKSWLLQDLMAIDAYNNPNPTTVEEQQNKERAGGLGFLITIQKPYYWQATTTKEKDFFIFSLIKIFKMHTGGKLPQLHGFDAQELEQRLGPAPSSDTRPTKSPSQPSRENRRGPSQGPPYVQGNWPTNSQQSERSLQNGRDIRPRPSEDNPSKEQTSHTRPHPIPSPRGRLSREPTDQSSHSADSIPRIPGAFPSSDFVRNLRPKNSQSELKTRDSQSPLRQDGDSDDSGKPTRHQEPDLRKLAGARSTESFRNRAGQQSGRNLPGGGPNGERAQPDRTNPPVLSLTPSSQLPPETFETYKIPTPLRTGAPDNWSSSDIQKIEGTPSRAGSRLSSSQHTLNSEVSQERPTLAALQSLRTDLSRKSSGLSTRSDHREGSLHPESTESLDAAGTVGDTADTTINGEDQMKDPQNQSEILPKSPATEDTENKSGESFKASANLPTEDASEGEIHRPGLGPMIKKKSNKEIANVMLKAATAYSAFKPRAGGAAEKLLNSEKRTTDEHDGVSGVFPAPSIIKTSSSEAIKSSSSEATKISSSEATKTSSSEAIETPTQERAPEPQNILQIQSNELPPLQTTIVADVPSKTDAITSPAHDVSPVEQPLAAPSTQREERRRRRRSDHSSKYANSLGINHGLLEGRTSEFDAVLNELGWNEEATRRNTFEELQLGLRKEIMRLEAGTWLGVLENGDERVAAVGHMMDKVIAECEELECLLTLYNAELGTLSEDVAYIEAQSQGLQVQTANQKILHTELKNLLETISISTSDLQLLKDASLSQVQGIKAVEATLSQLYTAMLMVDPQLRPHGTRPDSLDRTSLDAGGTIGLGGTTLSSMRAVRDRKEGYRQEGRDFVQRFKQYMSIKFRGTEVEILSALEQRKKGSKPRDLVSLDYRLREGPKAGLWFYSPLILFAREMEPLEWDYLMRMYESSAKKAYQDEIQDHLSAWKVLTKKPWGEEDLLFTMQEKENESLVGRKLTVKRSKTLRSDGTSRISTGGKPQDGKMNAHEAFAGTLNDMVQVILVEQNFLVEYFHLSSLENSDFIDAIGTPPEARKGGSATAKKTFDPDRNMASRVLGMMEEIFSFWPSELQGLVDWIIEQETLQGVGLLFSLESQLFDLEETNQEFLTQTMSKVHDRLAALFHRFVDEQMRGIEETKVKIKKRKGVISFMKTFPEFSAAVESMLSPNPSLEIPPVRSMVNEAYQKLNKAMFESLKFIAKESPLPGAHGVPTATAAGDPEDKEALNYHILLIENMNHYVEEVHPRSNPVLEDWKARATHEMAEHMDLYLSAIIRRPLGKLLDFLESTESLLSLLNNNNSPTGSPGLASSNPPPSSIATRASHSRSTFKKLLAAHDSRETRRGIETLKKRVEKHFGDADEAELSRALVAKVLRQCEAAYVSVRERLGRVIAEVYEDSLELDWKREDVGAAFRR